MVTLFTYIIIGLILSPFVVLLFAAAYGVLLAMFVVLMTPFVSIIRKHN